MGALAEADGIDFAASLIETMVSGNFQDLLMNIRGCRGNRSTSAAASSPTSSPRAS